jgi:hypothetical protein
VKRFSLNHAALRLAFWKRSAAAGVEPFPESFPEPSNEHELQGSFYENPAISSGFLDGAYRDRTGDLRLAKPALSQLS